jgi:hypothetical protein
MIRTLACIHNHAPKGASFYVDYISSGMDTFIRYVVSDFCTSGGTFLYVERDPPVMIPTLDAIFCTSGVTIDPRRIRYYRNWRGPLRKRGSN